MRSELRIKPFLSRVDIGTLLTNFKGYFRNPEEALNFQEKVEKYISSDEFINYWLTSPDLRFGQALFNCGYQLFDKIYYYEDDEILRLCGYTDTESTMWISNYNEDGSKRDEPIMRFIDELDDLHLKKMIDEANNFKRAYPPRYLKLFETELAARGFTNEKVDEKALEWAEAIGEENRRNRMMEMFKLLKSTVPSNTSIHLLE